MEWQAILTAAIPILTLLGGGIAWWAKWRETCREKQRKHEVAMQDREDERQEKFLGALQQLTATCAQERKELQAQVEAQREKRLDEARQHIQSLHDIGERLRPAVSSATPKTT